jgi:hypothetical protein
MEDEIGGACGMDGEKGSASKVFVGKRKEAITKTYA